MKKLGFIILGFIIGAVLTYYLCPRDTNKMEKHEMIAKPSGVISVEEAKELNDNWTNTRKPAVDSVARQEGREADNRWTSWSLDEVEDYIAYSKKQSLELGYNMTGIRVYLGVYGENAGQDQKNLTTMFIVPTGEKKRSKSSSLGINLLVNNNNLPIPPLNRGSGGSGGYGDD